MSLTPALTELHTLLLRELERPEGGRVPSAGRLSPDIVIRWFYRRLLDLEDRWFPLVQLRPAALTPAQLPDVVQQAYGGWLYLGDGWSEEQAAALRSSVLSGNHRLFLSSPRTIVPLTDAESTLLRRLDSMHVTATDPALRSTRRHLLSQCRENGFVHIVGPPGTSKRSLVSWAHTHLQASTPLTIIGREGGEAPHRGQWALFEEISRLDIHRLQILRDRVAQRSTTLLAPARHMSPLSPLPGLIGDGPQMAALLMRAAQLAKQPNPVLITGEAGTGRTTLARAMHAASGRNGPIQVFMLPGVSAEIAEPLLFGQGNQPGLLHSARGGTLVLGEVSLLRGRAQRRLARVLQEGRLPGEAMPLDVRIVAISSVDLGLRAGKGEFHEELWELLAATTLALPPLRERMEDVLPLARAFLLREQPKAELSESWLTPLARQTLLAYDWPGNLRELATTMAHAAALTRRTREVDIAHLGDLAMGVRMRAPTLTTHTQDGPDTDVDTLRSLSLTTSAVTLRVPPLREREPQHIHALIHALLDGWPISTEALHALSRQPWWGNLSELRHAINTLTNSHTGPIDRAHIERRLPDLSLVGNQRPFRVLMFPSRSPRGDIEGMEQIFATPALIVGRVSSWREVERLYGEQPSQMHWLRSRIGLGVPGCLNLALEPRISRVHMLVTRSGDGLAVHFAPWARLTVEVQPLRPDAASAALVPGITLDVGPAAELRFRDRKGAVVFRFYVFAGHLAWEEHATMVLRSSPTPEPFSSNTPLDLTRSEER